MRLPDLLNHIIDAHLRLELAGNAIRVHGPQAALTQERLDAIKQHKPALKELLARRGGSFQAARLTWGQRALWSLYRLNPESPVYNLMMVLRLAPDVSPQRFQSALDQLVCRHESLRTTFEDHQGEPIQVIHRQGVMPISVSQASTWSEARFTSWLEDERSRPFNLERGPLMRTHLLQGTGAEGEDMLVVTIHHIISDFLTFALICDELNQFYDGGTGGIGENGSPITQFRHVVSQQRHWLQTTPGQAAWRFWQERLGGDMPVIELPLDRPRPPVQSFRGEKRRFRLDPQLSDRIRSFAASQGATPYTVMLTAFQIFLHRYTGQGSFPMGTFVAGRNHSAREKVLGYLTNPAVLLADVSPQSGFSRQLAKVRDDVLAAMTHEDFPFALLVEKLGIKRDPRFSPIFQVVFLWEFAQWQKDLSDSEGPIREVVLTGQGGAPFDLIFSLSEEGSGPYSGLWLTNPDIFDGQTVDRFHRHFQNLLTALLDQPQQSCIALPMLTAAETELAWVDWNQTSTRFATGLCLQEMVVRQAARTPEAVAVIHRDREISYAQLVHHANQLARDLMACGVEPEQLVAVVMARGWRQVAAVLGVQIAGAAYLPIDPGWPRDRRWQIMEQGGVQLAVGDQTLADPEHWPSHIARFSVTDRLVAREGVPLEILPTLQSPGHLAYVIFTSGSSGQPKGVAIEHAAAANTLHDINRRHGLGPRDRVLGLSTLSFDLSVYDIFGMLAVGGALVVPDDQEVREPAAWQRLVSRHRVTLWNTVPALMQLLISHCEEHSPSDIGAIETVMMSGDWIPVDLPDRIRALSPETRVFSYGGATEASIWSISYPIEEVQPQWRSIPYGKAIANQKFFVLDKHLEPCPVGVAGELYIGGVGLARGYFGDEAKTAASFIIHPRRGERLYRTGDLGRYYPDGNIEFLGRADFQVKVNGYRIELAEIESVLLDDARVKEAAVAVHDRVGGGKQLVAYVVQAPPAGRGVTDQDVTDQDVADQDVADQDGADQDGAATDGAVMAVDGLKIMLAAKLPEYMVPAVFIFLDQMPLSANGKVDRKALPEPDRVIAQGQGETQAPRSPVEKALAEIWGEVLGIERVGLNDNYFELGGDSILSIQIVSRASQRGIALSSRELFSNPTIARLAPLTSSREPELSRQPILGVIPLSPIQSWFLEGEHHQPAYFNQSLLLGIAGDIEPAWIQSALEEIQRVHDSARIQCTRQEEGWQQEISATAGRLSFEVRDGVDALNDPLDLQRLVGDSQGGFDLSRGETMRAVLVPSPGRGTHHLLLLVLHHMVVDAVSWRIILEDLEQALRCGREGRKVEVPQPTTPFAFWVKRLHEHAHSDGVTGELGFWTEVHRLGATATGVRQRAFAPEAANTHESSQTLRFRLDPQQISRLQQASAVANIHELLLTAVAGALAEWGGNPGLFLDLEGHGREELFGDVNLTRTLGWFTALYPVVFDFADLEHPGERLRKVRSTLAAVPARGIGYGLLRYLNAETAARLRACQPPDVVFNFLGDWQRIVPENGLLSMVPDGFSAAGHPRNRRAHLLEINALNNSEGMDIRLTFSREVHREEDIGALGDAIRRHWLMLADELEHRPVNLLIPEDFPRVRMEPSRLEGIYKHTGEAGIETILPITPQQYGVLYHALTHADSELYYVQLRFRMDHAVDVSAWRRAWEQLVSRHATFRTLFMDLEEENPIQVRCREVPLPWEELDIRHLDAGDQERMFEQFLEEERKTGFQLNKAPISRFYLIRTADEAYRFLWSHHHVICDGWSFAIILRDLFRFYRAGLGGATLEMSPPPEFGLYLDWRSSWNEESHREWWRHYLRGFTEPSPLAPDWVSLREGSFGTSFEVTAGIAEPMADQLNRLVRERGLTAHILLLGTWALLLHYHGGDEDVVFGVTRSGRPPEVPDVEHMVGLFINSVPARVGVHGESELLSWLDELHAQQLQAMPHSLLPLSAIQQCSELPADKPLFDSLLVIENYPMGSALQRDIEALRISDLGVVTRNSFPLTLNATPRESFALKIMVNDTRIDHERARRLVDHCRLLLEGMAVAPQCRLKDLIRRLSDHDRADRERREEAVLALSAGKLRAAGRRRRHPN